MSAKNLRKSIISKPKCGLLALMDISDKSG